MRNVLIGVLVVSTLVLTKCENQQRFPDNPPKINLKTESVTGKVGDMVTIRAHIEDDFALKYAKLVSLPLKIDTTISISKKYPASEASKDVIKSQIDFSHPFVISDIAASGESYKIKLKVEDVTSKISVATVTLKVE